MSVSTKTQTNANQEQKEIKTDFCKAINERRNLAVREEKANKYIAKCKQRKRAKAKRKERIKETIVLTLLYTILGLALVCKLSGVVISNANENTEQHTYSMQGELQGNCVVLEDGNCHEVDNTYANYTSEAKTVTVVLNNNGTENAEDDTIVNILNR